MMTPQYQPPYEEQGQDESCKAKNYKDTKEEVCIRRSFRLFIAEIFGDSDLKKVDLCRWGFGATPSDPLPLAIENGEASSDVSSAR